MDAGRRFGLSVKKYRKKAGMTQEELADAAHVTRSYMSDVETARRNVTIRIAARIAFALDVPLSKLFDETKNDAS